MIAIFFLAGCVVGWMLGVATVALMFAARIEDDRFLPPAP